MPTRQRPSDFWGPVRLWLVTDPSLEDDVVLRTAEVLDARWGSAVGVWFRDKRPEPNRALFLALEHQLRHARLVDSASARRASAHSLGEAESALERGAEALMLSPIFRQKFANAPTGVRFIEQVRARYPEAYLYALGGITAENAASCIRAGADGVTVQGAIWNAALPAEAAEEILIAAQGAAVAVGADSS